MTTFLPIHLLNNNPGAVHEDSIIDRNLIVRHSGRTTIALYDPSWPISSNLPENADYELLVVATKFTKLTFPLEPFQGMRTGIWRGIVIHPLWSVPDERESSYRSVRPTLFRRHGNRRTWVLVATSLGGLLMNPVEVKEAIGFAPKTGDFLLWEDARLDLYGVV